MDVKRLRKRGGAKLEYGVISSNRSVNATIYRCFEYICKEDIPTFLRNFKDQPGDSEQVMHTFRELILGAYLCSQGFKARYEQSIDGKTPDWVIVENSRFQAVLELTNFHMDRETENAIKRKGEARQIWVGWMKPNNERLYQRLQEKADAYERIVVEKNIPYIIAVFGDFFAALGIDEVREVVFKDYGGLFNDRISLTGVLFFHESSGRYDFEYIKNPEAQIGLELPNGSF